MSNQPTAFTPMTAPTPGAGPTHGSTTALDEAFERMASAGFELPNGFVNHGAMACEALDALGFQGELGEWARRFARISARRSQPRTGSVLRLGRVLGDYRSLPEWIGHFERAIADDGWAQVVEVWVPRLVPAMATALFHGVIRVGHAVRASRRLTLQPVGRNWHGRSATGRRATGRARSCPAPARWTMCSARSWLWRPRPPAITWPHRASISSTG